jgi:hypothetical protein
MENGFILAVPRIGFVKVGRSEDGWCAVGGVYFDKFFISKLFCSNDVYG